MAAILGIDYGTKRLGLALADDVTRMPAPLKTVVTGSRQEQLRAVIAAGEDYDVECYVVGLPLNMDDTEGPQAKLVRTFGDELASSSKKPVHYVDERLSSFAADDLLRPAELTRKKKKSVQDAVAATVILQTYFQSLPDRDEHDDQP